MVREINENIRELRRRPLQQHKYYCSQIGRAACVLSAQYAYFADQPERRKATGTAPGTQRYDGWFPCRVMQKKLSKFLIVPCHSCQQSLERGTNPSTVEGTKGGRTITETWMFPLSGVNEILMASNELHLPGSEGRKAVGLCVHAMR